MCQRCVEKAKANVLNAQAVSHLIDGYIRLKETGANDLAVQTATAISDMLPAGLKEQAEKGPEETEDQQGLGDMPEDLRAALANIFGIDPNQVKVVKFHSK